MKQLALLLLLLLIQHSSLAEKYVVTFELKQDHISLDPKVWVADSMNTVKFQLPVDKEYYDSVQIGERVLNKFRVGSLLFKGSFGNWNVKVVNKEIYEQTNSITTR